MIVLLIGLPGTGKTTLGSYLAARYGGILLDGDAVRSDLSKDLGFSHEDRVEQARRIGAVARILDGQGLSVFCSFICPTEECRQVFGERDLTVWMNRLSNRLFDDSTQMWENPQADIVIDDSMSYQQERRFVMKRIETL